MVPTLTVDVILLKVSNVGRGEIDINRGAFDLFLPLSSSTKQPQAIKILDIPSIVSTLSQPFPYSQTSNTTYQQDYHHVARISTERRSC